MVDAELENVLRLELRDQGGVALDRRSLLEAPRSAAG
jgi:hypothetical protein